MITPGYYEIECDVCHKKEFFQEGEDATLVGDWYYGIPGNGGHLCTDCWDSQENTRDEQAKLAQAEDNAIDYGGFATNEERREIWRARMMARETPEPSIPYASAIRDNLNGGGEK